MPTITSILLVTPDSHAALNQYLNIDVTNTNLDTLLLQSEKSIGIDDVKNAKRFAATPPIMSPQKYILIPDASRLTTEAQNALLKLLEEPPPYLNIVLAITNLHQLLETITSRCQIVTDTQVKSVVQAPDVLTPLLTQSPKARLDSLPPTPSKETAIDFCRQLIQSADRLVRQNPSSSFSKNLEILLDCQTQLTQNTNPTLTVTNSVLSLLPLPPNPATIAQLPEKN